MSAEVQTGNRPFCISCVRAVEIMCHRVLLLVLPNLDLKGNLTSTQGNGAQLRVFLIVPSLRKSAADFYATAPTLGIDRTRAPE